MRVGQPIRAHLIYPIFADNQLLLPADTIVSGTVIELRPDRHRRLRARFNADFTPFHIPVVRFTEITLPGGAVVPITAGPATDGAPIFRIVPPPPHKGNFITRELSGVVQVAKDDIAVFTAPGKGDRLLQLFYSQLPYHPQRIEKGTAWTVETSQPIDVTSPAPPASETSPTSTIPTAVTDEAPSTWLLQAYLSSDLTSATTKPGQEIRAIVAEPVFNPDHTIAVPQGAALIGTITRAKPARSFGRAGVLRFDFQQIILPNGQTSSVQASLKGSDSTTGQVLDAEGEAKPKPQDKLILPILLAAFAARPLDQDHGNRDQLSKDASGSNGVGFIGRIVGIAASSPNLAAGIGYYQVALSTYSRWIARGKQVTFARNTRVVIQTTVRRSAPLRPDTPLR